MGSLRHTSDNDNKAPNRRAGARATGREMAVAPLGAHSGAIGLLQQMQRTVGNSAVNQLLRQYTTIQRVTKEEQTYMSHLRGMGLDVTLHFVQRARERGVSAAQIDAAYSKGKQYRDTQTGGKVYYDSGSQVALFSKGGNFTTTYFTGFKRNRWVAL